MEEKASVKEESSKRQPLRVTSVTPKEGTEDAVTSGLGVRDGTPSKLTSTSKVGPHTVFTESADTVRTVRGGTPELVSGSVSTPSYPFPRMLPLEFSTPTETPGSHKPFMTLSPTVTPSPAKVAKSRIRQDFRESGHVPPHPLRSLDKSHGDSSHFETLNVLKPNALEIAINVQSELGLEGWWSQVTQALKKNYHVERATLAVATDVADVENVPWAQLATYYANEIDEPCTTNEARSLRSSLQATPLRPSLPLSEKIPDKPALSSIRGVDFESQPLPSRPKLEYRHSYAGYTSNQKILNSNDFLALAENDHGIKLFEGPDAFQVRKLHKYGEGVDLELKADRSKQQDRERSVRDSFVEDIYLPGRPQSGRVLRPVRPLESESNPLLTTAGVVRVLRRDLATVLTREYREGKSWEQGAILRDTQNSFSGLPGSESSHVRSASASSPIPSRSRRASKERKQNVSTKLSAATKGRSGGGLKGFSSIAPTEPKPRPWSVSSPSTYEDFEQFPGTPWAQSPAPSPAPQPDSSDNPFFSNLPDQGAFDEHAPEYEYNEPSCIHAIGFDGAQSIIQLPLIHPSGTVSPPQHLHLARGEQKPQNKGWRGERVLKSNSAGIRTSPDSESQSQRRIPIAILSILAPPVPYPNTLIDSLNELAPLLATSFYAARIHTHMQLELSALSRRRLHPGSRLNLRDNLSSSNAAVATGLNFVDTATSGSFSPVSPSSTTSAGTHSTANMHSPLDLPGGVSNIPTPGWERDDRGSKINTSSRKTTMTSTAADLIENNSDYFQAKSGQRIKDGAESSYLAQKTSSMSSRSISSPRKNVLHSQGANFQNTQPSLPSGTSSHTIDKNPENINAPYDITRVFKEPSSSILRTMIDNGATQQFIAESDAGNLVWANSKFLAYRNAGKENIHEQLWKNIYFKDLSRFRLEWNKSLETGEQLSHQVRLKRFDGHYRWFHIRFLPLKDKYGITKYWHGQAMDIHELHEAEVKAAKSKEKAASEAKYRAIANSLPVIVFAASVPTGMTFANTQWLSYSGQGLDEALGFGFLEHIHPDDLVKCRFPGFGSQSMSFHAQSNPRGTTSVRSESSMPSTGGESETTSVTDRTVMAASDDSKGAADVVIPNELLRGLANDGTIICAKDESGNLSITTEMRLKNRKGDYRWHLVQGSYMESVNFGQGDAQWFIACTDISNQKQNEAKIQNANSALETANMTLENEMRRRMGYLSSMSHEIRTPLNGIIGNLQLLINSGLNETNSEWAHSAQESAKNMHDLINDILDLSKAEANMLQLSFSWFNPREIMEQVLDMLSSKASEKRLEFICECSEAVPRMLRGDPGRIRQVLLNLVGNAIKFTSYGEVVIRCTLLPGVPEDSDLPSLSSNEVLVNWSVSDTGSGFSEEEKKLLFKPYSQIKNKNTRDSGGTGLGLILCKTMVSLHGGVIDAYSSPERGSEFTFFARFKARKPSAIPPIPGTASPFVSSPGGPILSSVLNEHLKELPTSKYSALAESSRESPTILSDSSSARSFSSTAYRTSVRSSMSTVDSKAPGGPPLPSPVSSSSTLEHTHKPQSTGPPSDKTNKNSRPVASGNLMPHPILVPTATIASDSSPSVSLHAAPKAREASRDPERSGFRPPMLSILVVCPAENTRRITCDQIRFVVSGSAPCTIMSEARVDAAEKLMHGDDPIAFTHVFFRVASDELLAGAVRHLLQSPMHIQACLVILTDQAQVKFLRSSLSEFDLDEMNRKDQVKLVLKPAHVYKLAKVLDPFNENFQNTGDPKEAKRSEEKRLQKESYALFKKVLGNKGMRVMAVEDNSVQMSILCNFLQKICHLDVVQAWNGQECLDLYKTHGSNYFSVIVTDIEMPVLDGLSMCRLLREWEEDQSWPPANIISLSANTYYEGWTQSSAAGFTHYCPKPVSFRDLGHIILELTDPEIPHKFLREREMPRAMLKKLGLLSAGEDSSEESDDIDDRAEF